jgi:murein hydrolase activator
MSTHRFHQSWIILIAIFVIALIVPSNARAEKGVTELRISLDAAEKIKNAERSELPRLKKDVSEIKNKITANNCYRPLSGLRLDRECMDLAADFSVKSIMLESAKREYQEALDVYNKYRQEYQRALGRHIANLAIQRLLDDAVKVGKKKREAKRRAYEARRLRWHRLREARRRAEEARRRAEKSRQKARDRRRAAEKRRRAAQRRLKHSVQRSKKRRNKSWDKELSATQRRLQALQPLALKHSNILNRR